MDAWPTFRVGDVVRPVRPAPNPNYRVRVIRQHGAIVDVESVPARKPPLLGWYDLRRCPLQLAEAS